MSVTSVNALPIDCVMQFMELSEPSNDALVCKQWRDAKRLAAQFALDFYKKDPNSLILFANVDPNPAPNQLLQNVYKLFRNINQFWASVRTYYLYPYPEVKNYIPPMDAIYKELQQEDPAQLSYFISELAPSFPLSKTLNIMREWNFINFFNTVVPDVKRPTFTCAPSEKMKEMQDWLKANLPVLQVGSHLGSNQLMYLPPEIGFFHTRDQLCLTGPIIDISEIGLLNQLTALNVHESILRNVPKSIGLLANLTTLALCSNKITFLPDEFCQLTNLESITIENNQLSALPNGFSQLTKLKFLNIANNCLVTLPNGFCQLTNLAKLSIHSNRLSALPQEFTQLENLRILNVSSNPLIKPKEEVRKIAKLSKLHTLSLINLKLPGLPKDIGNLTRLDMDGISLEDNLIPEAALKAIFVSYKVLCKFS